jgi:hypothetical protein
VTAVSQEGGVAHARVRGGDLIGKQFGMLVWCVCTPGVTLLGRVRGTPMGKGGRRLATEILCAPQDLRIATDWSIAAGDLNMHVLYCAVLHSGAHCP